MTAITINGPETRRKLGIDLLFLDLTTCTRCSGANRSLEAVELTEPEGVTQAEAAARLGLSPSGMKSRVQRARAQLNDLPPRQRPVHPAHTPSQQMRL